VRILERRYLGGGRTTRCGHQLGRGPIVIFQLESARIVVPASERQTQKSLGGGQIHVWVWAVARV